MGIIITIIIQRMVRTIIRTGHLTAAVRIMAAVLMAARVPADTIRALTQIM